MDDRSPTNCFIAVRVRAVAFRLDGLFFIAALEVMDRAAKRKRREHGQLLKRRLRYRPRSAELRRCLLSIGAAAPSIEELRRFLQTHQERVITNTTQLGDLFQRDGAALSQALSHISCELGERAPCPAAAICAWWRWIEGDRDGNLNILRQALISSARIQKGVRAILQCVDYAGTPERWAQRVARQRPLPKAVRHWIDAPASIAKARRAIKALLQLESKPCQRESQRLRGSNNSSSEQDWPERNCLSESGEVSTSSSAEGELVKMKQGRRQPRRAKLLNSSSGCPRKRRCPSDSSASSLSSSTRAALSKWKNPRKLAESLRLRADATRALKLRAADSDGADNGNDAASSPAYCDRARSLSPMSKAALNEAKLAAFMFMPQGEATELYKQVFMKMQCAGKQSGEYHSVKELWGLLQRIPATILDFYPKLQELYEGIDDLFDRGEEVVHHDRANSFLMELHTMLSDIVEFYYNIEVQPTSEAGVLQLMPGSSDCQ